MKVGRSAFACALAGVLAGGIVAGNLWVRWHFERERSARSFAPRADERLTDGPDRAAGVNAILSGGWQPEMEDEPGREGPAFGALPPLQPPEPGFAPPAAPKRLLHSEHAVPIAGRGERDPALLKIIAEELPNASPEDRRVWLERVRDLPPQAVREMLRLRRTLGSPLDAARRTPESDDAPREAVLAGPTSKPQDDLPSIESAMAAMQHARAILLNNLANAETDGFKRVEVSFRDLSYDVLKFDGISDGTANIAIGRGVRLAPTELDLAPGALRASANPLHIAVDGEGFFQVSDGQHVLYTRLGRFCRGAEGNLVLTCGNGSLALEPAVGVPADVTRVRIGHDGTVSACEGEDESWTECGRVLLARFARPEALVPQGDRLLAASDSSGAPRLGAPGDGGRGEVKQFALERSNVDPDAEIAALEQLQRRIEQLQRLAGGTADSPIAQRSSSFHSGSAMPAALEQIPGVAPVRHWLQQLAGVVEKQLSESQRTHRRR